MQQQVEPAWWGPVWRGLVADREARHYRRMRCAFWLFAYLIIHADRQTGSLTRRYRTIAADMGIPERTVRRWLFVLRRHGYVIARQTGRSLVIHISKWRALSGTGRVA
ncbi:MAG: helix-turn-helix domain-containing protein [Acidobacteriota bacterium]|nr:helix-turn-helix domain-containing protein [Acidobacteriota bacterium]